MKEDYTSSVKEHDKDNESLQDGSNVSTNFESNLGVSASKQKCGKLRSMSDF